MAQPGHRGGMVRWLLLLASVGVSACAAPGALLYAVPIAGFGVGALVWQLTSGVDEKGWRRVTSPRFTVETDLELGDAGSVSRQLELWETALERGVFAGEPVEPNHPTAEPLLVVAVRSHLERSHLTRGGDLLGLYSELDVVPPFVLAGDPLSADGRETLQHEVVHAFVQRRWPEAPRWLDEGLARYLQNAELNQASGSVSWRAGGFASGV